MNKHSNKKNHSRIKKFWTWLGKQNVFYVFTALFLLIYGSTKTFAYFFPDTGLGKNNTNKSSVKVMELPKATPSPTIKKQDFDSVPFIHPNSSPTVSPTIDLDPIIDCKRPENCGGGTNKIKQSECFSKVCCPVDKDKYETLTYDECYKKQSDYFKKQNEEYLKKKNEETQRLLDKYKETEEQYYLKLNEYSQENELNENQQNDYYKQQNELNFNICVSDAKAKAYRECVPRNTCDSFGYGSPSWVIEQETAKCRQIYGL